MNPAVVLIPLFVLGAGFAAFCLVDIARAEDVRHLPRPAWAAICVVSIPLGGIIYLVAGRVSSSRDYKRGYQAAQSAVTGAGEVIWPGLGSLAGQDFDLRRWAASQQASARQAAAGTEPFRLPAWFARLADDLGSMLDPVGFERWSFTPSIPFVRGYEAALHDAWQATEPAARC